MQAKQTCQLVPMSLHYVNDGSGRDGYIRTNNGGFSIANAFGKPGPGAGEM